MVQRVFLSLVCVAALAAPAAAAPITFAAFLSGPNESPVNASPGTGFATVVIDDVAHFMEVNVTFQGLLAGNTASHIHVINGPGDANLADTVGPVATSVPTFTGFPTGAASGTYNHTFDMSLASSYNPAFVLAAGGGVPQAEAALFAGIATGRAYLNIHSTMFPGGEIRGFLTPVPEPATMLLLATGLGGVVRMRRRRRT